MVLASNKIPHDGVLLLKYWPEMLRTNLLITVAFLVPVTLSIGVLVTFKIAGPIYKFEWYLGQLAQGVYPGPCKLRENDELWDLCHVLNSAVERLRNGGVVEQKPGEPAASTESEEVTDADSVEAPLPKSEKESVESA